MAKGPGKWLSGWGKGAAGEQGGLEAGDVGVGKEGHGGEGGGKALVVEASEQEDADGVGEEEKEEEAESHVSRGVEMVFGAVE